MKCTECKEWVSKAWINAACHKTYTKCLDCVSPRCRNPACKACKSCRNPTCNESTCQKKPKASNNRTLQHFSDKKKFICETCLYPACKECGTEMPKKTKERKRKSEEWKNPTAERHWTCSKCDTLLDGRKAIQAQATSL